MIEKKVLIVKNIDRESPGLIRTVFERNKIGFVPYNPTRRSFKFPNPRDYSAIFVLGGPMSANYYGMNPEVDFVKRALEAEIPYFGVCLGEQVLGKAAGGIVYPAEFKEVGCYDLSGQPYMVELTEKGIKDQLFNGVGSSFEIFQLHGETVGLNGKIELLGVGKGPHQTRTQVIKVGKNAYGIQGHFEPTKEMVKRWIQHDKMFDEHDKTAIQSAFDKMVGKYHANGTRIIENFLEIAA